MSNKKNPKKKRVFRQVLARTLQTLRNLPPYQSSYNGPLNTIAILAQEKYGDAILLTPLLKNLKKEFPETAIHLVTFSKAATDFFSTDPNVTAIHYAKGNQITYFKGILHQKFDLLFNTKDHPSRTFLIHSLVIRARCRTGIASDFHEGLYDYLVDTDYHSPIPLKNCGLMTILGKPVPAESCRPYLPPKPVSEKIKQFLETPGLKGALGINISAGWPTRHWTDENWKTFANAFPDRRIVVLSSPDDLEAKTKLECSCPNILTSPSTSNLYEAGMIIDQLRLLITPDTSLVHVASCQKTPVVGLYVKAPQHQSRFKPFLIDYQQVISPTEFVRDITPEAVISAVNKLLQH